MAALGNTATFFHKLQQEYLHACTLNPIVYSIKHQDISHLQLTDANIVYSKLNKCNVNYHTVVSD